MSETIHCHIYRSLRKDGLYLFLLEEADIERLPDAVKKGVGKLEKAMELDISPDRKLARSDPAEVIANLKAQGFHLQLPPQDEAMRPAK
jgi:uncharacterized protein